MVPFYYPTCMVPSQSYTQAAHTHLLAFSSLCTGSWWPYTTCLAAIRTVCMHSQTYAQAACSPYTPCKKKLVRGFAQLPTMDSNKVVTGSARNSSLFTLILVLNLTTCGAAAPGRYTEAPPPPTIGLLWSSKATIYTANTHFLGHIKPFNYDIKLSYTISFNYSPYAMVFTMDTTPCAGPYNRTSKTKIVKLCIPLMLARYLFTMHAYRVLYTVHHV